MKLAYWQIIVSGGGGLLAVFVAPFIAARLAVRRLGRELDNARLDELRGVLDEAVVALAHAARVQAECVVALRTEEGPLLDPLDAVIAELVVIYWRLALRLGSDSVSERFAAALDSCQDVHAALVGYVPHPYEGPGVGEGRQELHSGRTAFADRHRLFLDEARTLAGPSKAALARSRRELAR